MKLRAYYKVHDDTTNKDYEGSFLLDESTFEGVMNEGSDDPDLKEENIYYHAFPTNDEETEGIEIIVWAELDGLTANTQMAYYWHETEYGDIENYDTVDEFSIEYKLES